MATVTDTADRGIAREVAAQEAFAELLAPDGLDDPYPHFARLREYGPVLWISQDRLVVSRYADCDRVLRDPAFRVRDVEWADRSWPDWRRHAAVALYFDGWVVGRDGDRHETAKRGLGTHFTARRVAAQRADIADRLSTLVDRLAERLAGGGPVDFMAKFARPLPMAVLGGMLDLPEADRGWLRERIEHVVPAVDHNVGGTDLPRADAATTELTGYFGDLVAERRRRPGDDVISALLAGGTQGEDLVPNLIFLSGSLAETTTNLLGNGMRVLLDRPEEWRRLAGRPDLAPAYVTEILRYDTMVPVVGRWPERDSVIGGEQVPAHTLVLVLLGSANRDPARFADPDRFDPDRTGTQVLSFAAGAHYCLGAPTARLVGELAFAALATACGPVEPAGPADRRYTLATRGLTTLPIRRAAGDG